MTETEEAHFEKIKELWLLSGHGDNWDLTPEDTDGMYNAKVRDGKMLWFQYKLNIGWSFVKIES